MDWLLGGWLKTTTSAEVGQEEQNLHAAAPRLTVYFDENNTLRGSIIAMLWHGSCFSLFGVFRHHAIGGD
ncbi:MAG: hypothetical protein WAN60_22210, partial [Candidatus Sulfotelmatobacter sp.]